VFRYISSTSLLYSFSVDEMFTVIDSVAYVEPCSLLLFCWMGSGATIFISVLPSVVQVLPNSPHSVTLRSRSD
jgi:hypothetical protein